MGFREGQLPLPLFWPRPCDLLRPVTDAATTATDVSASPCNVLAAAVVTLSSKG
jgi:hypothetical protein